MAGRDDRLPCGAAADAIEIFVQLVTRFAPDSAIDTAAWQQCGVCGIHNGIHLKRGDVRLNDANSSHQLHGPCSAQWEIRWKAMASRRGNAISVDAPLTRRWTVACSNQRAAMI